MPYRQDAVRAWRTLFHFSITGPGIIEGGEWTGRQLGERYPAHWTCLGQVDDLTWFACPSTEVGFPGEAGDGRDTNEGVQTYYYGRDDGRPYFDAYRTPADVLQPRSGNLLMNRVRTWTPYTREWQVVRLVEPVSFGTRLPSTARSVRLTARASAAVAATHFPIASDARRILTENYWREVPVTVMKIPTAQSPYAGFWTQTSRYEIGYDAGIYSGEWRDVRLRDRILSGGTVRGLQSSVICPVTIGTEVAIGHTHLGRVGARTTLRGGSVPINQGFVRASVEREGGRWIQYLLEDISDQDIGS